MPFLYLVPLVITVAYSYMSPHGNNTWVLTDIAE